MLFVFPNVFIPILIIAFLGLAIRMYDVFVLKPKRLRSLLKRQGLVGPPSSFLLGNIREMRKTMKKNYNNVRSIKPSKVPRDQPQHMNITHNCSSTLFPFFDQWRKEYGSVFMFSLGNIQLLYACDPDFVREKSMCTSLNLGKPSYQYQKLGPLLGQGILTSNGARWCRQRKIIAPELFPDKVKGMIKLMVESSSKLVNLWNEKIDNEGSVDLRIDEYMRSFSGDVISRACFGSNYSKGEEIFVKLRALQEALANKFLSCRFSARYLPTKSNREIWRLEKELRSLILKVVKERKEATIEKDLLQMILQSDENSNLDRVAADNFIVDNCKNIYLAGYETTAVSATWTLMLLALNPHWQAKVREEVIEICGGQPPNADMLRRMKMLTMVIHESLRLYPPVTVVSREALQDMKFGNISVPKGVIIWTLVVTLHQDPEIWGPDAHVFNPQRFANGVSRSCKFPHVYMPFGAGPRMCAGQNFAMAELKVLIALLVSKFSFSISPYYVHSPTLRMVLEPEFGVHLIVKKL